jgi:hypothetical protein
MGQVHRAEDVVLGRTVAVRIVRPTADVSQAPERVRNEVTLLAAVQHPSLVTLLDARIEDAGSSYLVMEYVDGPSLARRLRAGALTEIEVATLAVDLASGLDAVHAQGIVHRDLTPSNILLASSALSRAPFHAKLADFGVAFLLDSTRLTTPGMVVGTAAYLAPEQVRGDAAAPPADVYALGLVLIEALTGERAYPHASGIGAVMARLVEPPKIPESVGPVWTGLLTRMVSSDPTERPTAREVAVVAADLRKAARSAPLVAQVPAPTAATSAASVAPVAPATPMPTQPLEAVAAPSPLTRSAGSGERARLRRARSRRGRMRRTVVLVSSAAVVAALAIPAGIWATAGHSEEPAFVATVPDVVESEPLVPAVEPAANSSEGGVVPAGVSAGPGPDEEAAKQAREQQKLERDRQRESSQAAAQAEREQAKAPREAGKEAGKDAAKDAGKGSPKGPGAAGRDR